MKTLKTLQTEEIRKTNKQIRKFKAGLKTAKKYLNTWEFRNYLTPGQKKNFDKYTLKELKTFALNRYEADKNKQLEKDLNLLEQIYNATNVEYIRIYINWSKSATWGSNPVGEIWIRGEQSNEYYKTRSIGGCGYCKESTAFAEAFNQSLSCRKLLLNSKIKGLYGYSDNTLNEGVGVSCFVTILEKLGFKHTSMHGNSFDGYEFRK